VTSARERLEQERDQALRDLVDLDRQVAGGELPLSVADELRAEYERTAAAALARLSEPASAPPQPEAVADSRSSHARRTAYALALGLAVFAAVVLLPDSVAERIAGGAVTGNEVFGTAAPGGGTAPRDLSTVTNAELEDVVAQNPDVIDMRLALAHRYLDGADYLAAARHYLVALRQEPRNVEAQSHYGWVLMQAGEPAQALEYVDRSLAQDPRQMEALWFKANIALYGLSDPVTALAVLEQLRQRADLEPDVRTQVDGLVEVARAQVAGG